LCDLCNFAATRASLHKELFFEHAGKYMWAIFWERERGGVGRKFQNCQQQQKKLQREYNQD
jgi:hypothetical protein